MAYEDFTDDWTETDPDGELTVAAAKLEIDALNGDGDAFFYKDGGANHFTDELTHQCEITVDTVPSMPQVWIWGLANSTGFSNGNDEYMTVYPYDNEGNFVLVIFSQQDMLTSDYDMSSTLSTGTKYYLTITRSGGTVTCVIKTTSHSGSTVDTISCTDYQTSFRYLIVVREDED